MKKGFHWNFTDDSDTVLYCEFCKISKSTCFKEHLWMTASNCWNEKYSQNNRRSLAILTGNNILFKYKVGCSWPFTQSIYTFFYKKNFCKKMSLKNPKTLTRFWPMFPFYAPWKHQKSEGFPVISGRIKWEHWSNMGSENVKKIPSLKCLSFNF